MQILEIVEIGEDLEFQKFVSKIIKFISHELEANKGEKFFQNHKTLHKKLTNSLLNINLKENKLHAIINKAVFISLMFFIVM